MIDAHLVEKLSETGVFATESNIRNMLAREKFAAVFLVQRLETVGYKTLRLSVAVLIALSALGGDRQPASAEGKGQRGYSQNAAERRRLNNPRLYEPSCDAPENNEEADLCAQKEMAEAARDLTFISWLQFLVGAIGLGSVVVSLYFTRQAVLAAKDQTKLTRQAMTSAERAYVAYSGCSWISHFNEETTKYFWRISARWHNAGNTPTRELNVSVGQAIVDQKFTLSTPLPLRKSEGIVPIQPGGVILTRVADIDGEQVLRIKNGELLWYVWGEVTYRDVFDFTPVHKSRFLVQGTNITGDPLKGWSEKDNPVGIEFAILDWHNCADEECECSAQEQSNA